MTRESRTAEATRIKRDDIVALIAAGYCEGSNRDHEWRISKLGRKALEIQDEP